MTIRCPNCGSQDSITRRTEDRIFQCRTGPVDQGVPHGIPFGVTVPNCVSDECGKCMMSFHPAECVRRMEEVRREAVARIAANQEKEKLNNDANPV